MFDHFSALVDELYKRDQEKARASTRAARRAPPPKPAPSLPPGGFDTVLQKAQQLRDSFPRPRRDYGAELDNLLTKAMAGFAAGTMSSFEVAKLEDMVERARHDCIVKGLI